MKYIVVYLLVVLNGSYPSVTQTDNVTKCVEEAAKYETAHCFRIIVRTNENEVNGSERTN